MGTQLTCTQHACPTMQANSSSLLACSTYQSKTLTPLCYDYTCIDNFLSPAGCIHDWPVLPFALWHKLESCKAYDKPWFHNNEINKLTPPEKLLSCAFSRAGIVNSIQCTCASGHQPGHVYAAVLYAYTNNMPLSWLELADLLFPCLQRFQALALPCLYTGCCDHLLQYPQGIQLLLTTHLPIGQMLQTAADSLTGSSCHHYLALKILQSAAAVSPGQQTHCIHIISSDTVPMFPIQA